MLGVGRWRREEEADKESERSQKARQAYRKEAQADASGREGGKKGKAMEAGGLAGHWLLLLGRVLN